MAGRPLVRGVKGRALSLGMGDASLFIDCTCANVPCRAAPGSTARNRGGGVKAQKVRFGGRNWPSPISYITQISNREVTSKPDQRPSGASTVACSATMRSVKVFGNLPNRQPSCGFPPTHLCRNTTQSDNVAGSRMLRSRARIERANSHGYGRCGASQTG